MPDDTTPPDEPQTFDAEYVRKLRAEAAERRTAQRELEQRVEQLQAQVDGYRQQDFDRTVTELADGRLADPRDLLAHVERDELTTDDGAADPDRVAHAIDRLLSDRPHLRASLPRGDADGGSRGAPVTRSPSFGDVLRGRTT